MSLISGVAGFSKTMSANKTQRVTDSQVSRRDVVKTAGLLTAAGVAFPYVSRGADENKLIRIGLVGAGGRGTGAADQTLSVAGSNVKLVAVADAFADKVSRAVTNLGNKHKEKVDVTPDRQFVGLDGYKKIFDHCDLVILATPPGFRPDMFAAAVKAGKHVFMEKPVCVDAAGAKIVLDAAKEADAKGLKVVVGLQRHYAGNYRETAKRIQDGMIGQIISANVYWNGGPIWYRKREEGMTETMFQVHNWYHFCYLSGDHICEQHVHNLDVANWFLGETPSSAFGIGGRQMRPADQPSEIYDHFGINYLYASGASVSSHCRQIPGGQGRVTEEFRGTKGFATPGKITNYKGETIWKYEGKNDNPYQVEHDELHDAIRKNTPLNNAYYGATSSFTAALGRYAAYSGKELKYDEVLKSGHRIFPESIDPNGPAPVKPNADGSYTIPVARDYKM
jgi:predicted dehydrogenase